MIGMQAGGNTTLDANAAHPPEIRKDDPRHLGNLTKKMGEINSQVSSDTKYDPAPPPRVDRNGNTVRETFVSSVPPPDAKLANEFLYAVGATAVAVLVAIAVIIVDPVLRKKIMEIEYSLPLMGSVSLLAAMTIWLVDDAMDKNEMILWYPSLRG
jgi:hypothetical protein